MLTLIVFSKDRPLQLDLLLKSIELNFPLFDSIQVIASIDKNYISSYAQIIKEHKNVYIFNDVNIPFQEILNSVTETSNDYVMFLTDDNIIYRESKTTELDLGNLFSRDIACLSLRLGVNITNRPGFITSQPKFSRIAGSHLVWNRMSVLATDYFNYPLSVDGHIFRKESIMSILNDIKKCGMSFKNPNQFEQVLQRYFFEVSPFMASELYSCVVNSPNNRVQETVKNWYGEKYNYSQNDLKILYDEGKRISLNSLDFSNIVCPHTEIDILKNIC